MTMSTALRPHAICSSPALKSGSACRPAGSPKPKHSLTRFPARAPRRATVRRPSGRPCPRWVTPADASRSSAAPPAETDSEVKPSEEEKGETHGDGEDFDAFGLDIYSFYDQNYSDVPRQKGGYTLATDTDGKAMSVWTYVDPNERLPEDYKFAVRTGESLKEVILLQGFHWDSWKHSKGWYNCVAGMVDEILDLGITHIWLPPPSQSVSNEGYLPSVLYNMDSKYGSHRDLKDLLARLNTAGVVPLADIVINHRCAQEQDEDGKWNIFGNDYQEQYGLGGYGADHMRGVDWGKWAITGDDPVFGGTGNPDSGADFEAAPDLDHHNLDLRAALKDWLNWLHNDIGFMGWRLDFVKGYAPKYVKEYIEDTIGADHFHVSELWTDMRWEGSNLADNQDAARQALCNWIDQSGGTSTVFDFPLKGILQYAITHCEYHRLAKDGKPTGLIGWWPEKAVTFIDNHDTGGSQNHWPFPAYHVAAGYAYLFTHPGMPCIFWPHLFDNEKLKITIAELIQLRKRNGIKSDSKVKIRCAEDDMYIAVIDDKVTIKMGPRYEMGGHVPKEKDGWKFALSGKDFAVWEKHK